MIKWHATRSHTCGGLRDSNLGEDVVLCGWVAKRRNLGGLIFVDVRDRFGMTQIVFDPSLPECQGIYEDATRLRAEFVIGCKGRVRLRPQGGANEKMPTGKVEVLCSFLHVFSEAKTTPFVIDDETEVSEVLRLKYRYLDLRRPSLQKNLLMRHRMLSIMRKHLDEHQFLEIETPLLYKSTPEGARDFVVPSRLNPGSFYALPQSPQILKQLLMIGCVDRYFQLARCFRDEDLRADRQPEFSQMDIEASFLSEEGFFPIIETLVAKLWKELLGVVLPVSFPRMSYREALERFGTDKPDTRFGLELVDLSFIFENSPFEIFKNALAVSENTKRGSIRGIRIPNGSSQFSRKDLEELQKVALSLGAKRLFSLKFQEEGSFQSSLSSFLSVKDCQLMKQTLRLEAGDLVLIVAESQNNVVFDALGAVRLSVGAKLDLIPPFFEGEKRGHDFSFLWIVHFPLLEFSEVDQRYYACHHPFTAPRPAFISDLMEGKNLGAIEACAYDLVLNGVEIGGGSFRIYQPQVQEAMFQALGLSSEEVKEKFGFFIEALQYGTPPHGGIALGVDRLAAILSGVGPIRDVIAFPKTQKGHCLMSECPSALRSEQLEELGLRF